MKYKNVQIYKKKFFITLFLKFLFFYFCIVSFLFPENAVDYLNNAILEFKKGRIEESKKLLRNSLLKDTSIQNNYEYLKLQYIIHLITENYYNADTYYILIDSLKPEDSFFYYLRIFHLLNFNQYNEIEKVLNHFININNFELNKKTILPILCSIEDKKYDYNILNRKKFDNLWRTKITNKEYNFILFLNNVYKKDKKWESYIQNCLKYTNKKNQYHLYRFLIYINDNYKNNLDFYNYLYNNKKYLESLHVLRKIYFEYYLNTHFLDNKETYNIFKSLKETYKMLNYIQQVDTLNRFLDVLEKNQFDIQNPEVQKIATENYRLRELLWLLYTNTNEENKKNFYFHKIQEYDTINEQKEKLLFFRSLYYYP